MDRGDNKTNQRRRAADTALALACGIVGTSQALRIALKDARLVAPTTMPVLLLGETGTGKESATNYVHRCSGRPGELVAINCAAISPHLLESELFGHERGAFTGADRQRLGAFERAHRGTLFLDEIGDMPLDQQAKLLRTLQEGEVLRVGGSKLHKADVRIVAATNRDLDGLAAQGRFRQDLLYRLNAFSLVLPPLRTRGHDVVQIARAVLTRTAPGKRLSRAAERLLMQYAWPGNIRQLENVVRAAAVVVRGCVITDDVLRRRPPLAGFTPASARRGESRGAQALQLLERQGRLSAASVQQGLKLSRTQTWRVLKMLEREGAVVLRGRGCSAHYVGAASAGSTSTALLGGDVE